MCGTVVSPCVAKKNLQDARQNEQCVPLRSVSGQKLSLKMNVSWEIPDCCFLDECPCSNMLWFCGSSTVNELKEDE